MYQFPDDDDLDLPDDDDKAVTQYKFPSAEGYTVDPNWKPTLDKPLPALRCGHIKRDGTQCKRFAVRGTGLNGTKPVCMSHGGQLPVVQEAAKARIQAMRLRLIDDAGLAVDTLFDLMANASGEGIKLGAAREILDRAGLKGPADITVEVEHKLSPADAIRDRLAGIAKRMDAGPINLGETDGETVPDTEPEPETSTNGTDDTE